MRILSIIEIKHVPTCECIMCIIKAIHVHVLMEIL